MNCSLCKHRYLDMDNNDRCELKHYPESNIIRRNWGQWKVDASRCKNYVDFRTKEE